MTATPNKPMNKFGLEEIRAIRDRWAEMPKEEYKAEQKELLASAMRRLGITREEKADEAQGQ